MFNRILGLIIITASLFTGALVFMPRTSMAASGSNTKVIVQTIAGPTVAQKVIVQAKSSWPWYVARGSGMAAAIILVILILSGIGQVTGYTYRFLDPLTAWASHRVLGITLTASVLIHMASLLFDHFVPFSIIQILVPWMSSYKPTSFNGHNLGSLWVALGILSFYLIIIVLITSLVWVEKKPYTWKFLHLLSYLIIFFVFMHGLYTGTDLVSGVYRYIWIGSGVAIVLATLNRLWRAKTT